MRRSILILNLILAFSCSQNTKAPDPKSELQVEEEMIRQAIYEIKSKEILEMQFPRLDSISIKYPNSVEAKRARYLLSKKDSLYALVEKVKEEEHKSSSSIRKAYQEELRNTFLDNGFDIKVKISNVDYDEMTLEYALFNDVWFRKFETNGNFNKWFKMGFVKITLTDNNGYSKYTYIE